MNTTVTTREGVTAGVAEKMDAVGANVLAEDGLLLRTCEHGVRHPVGNIHTGYVSSTERADRHERRGAFDGSVRVQCCDERCCLNW